MAGLIEINQVGKREDLADFISLVDMKEKPLLAMIPKGKAIENMYMRWQADRYETPDLSGIADGVDVGAFENGAKNRVELSNYCQKRRRAAFVGDLAENVSDIAGAAKGELARATTKKLEELSRDIESVLCSDQDARLETSEASPYLTRGLGSWISSTAQTVLPVPSDFRTPANSLNTTSTSTLSEQNLRAVLKSVYQQTGRSRNLVLLCGPALKEAVTNFTASKTSTAGADAYTFATTRTYNSDLNKKRMVTSVTVYEGDFNTVELYTSLFLAQDAGTVAAVQNARGYVIDPEMLELRWNRLPRVMPLTDAGGGPRNLVDAVFGLVVKNPLALGKFSATT